jgi:hypothetical protein
MPDRKILFLNDYLEEYRNNNEEIRNLLNKNECKIIPYRQINNKTKIDKYDYIIIIGKTELKRIVKGDLNLYKNYKNKLFFIGNLCNSYNKYDDYKNILYEIKNSLSINIYKKHNNRIELTNLTQNISINDAKINNPVYNYYSIESYNSVKNVSMCLPSSLKHLNMKLEGIGKRFFNNAPNSIIMVCFDAREFITKNIRLPKNAILKVNYIVKHNNMSSDDLLKNILPIKTKMTFIKSTNEDNWRYKRRSTQYQLYKLPIKDIEDSLQHENKVFTITKKNDENLKFSKDIYQYKVAKKVKSVIYFCKKNINKKYVIDNIWGIISKDSMQTIASSNNNADYFMEIKNLESNIQKTSFKFNIST